MKSKSMVYVFCMIAGSLQVFIDTILLTSSKHEIYSFWLTNLTFFS